MRPAWIYTQTFSGGGRTAEEEYTAKKRMNYEWRVVDIFDASHGKDVQVYEHVSNEPTKPIQCGPNKWGSGDPQFAEEVLNRALARVDEDEPCFIPVSAEGPPPSSKSKRKRMIVWDGLSP